MTQQTQLISTFDANMNATHYFCYKNVTWCVTFKFIKLTSTIASFTSSALICIHYFRPNSIKVVHLFIH